jgi:hypothetical protein
MSINNEKNMNCEIVVEIVHRKLSKRCFPSKNGKIVGHLEVYLHSNDRKPYRTKSITISSGALFSFPWISHICMVKINFFLVNENLTEVIGSTFIDNIHDRPDYTIESYDILKNNHECIGRIQCKKYCRNIFATDSNSKPSPQDTSSNSHQLEEIVRKKNVPGFRFRKLSRPINWDRIKLFNLDRYCTV